MDKSETLYLTQRDQWRNWLSANFNTRQEIWLVYPKKSTGKPRIEYNTAVEEALCFGWIDSIVRALDPDHTIQRFSVRRPKSGYSQANKERLKWLNNRGMIHPSIIQTLVDTIQEKYIFPPDIIAKIKSDKTAWRNFQNFSEPYKRIRIAYIDSARKRPDAFEKRLHNFLAKTKQNKLIKGFGGIEKYY